jgi:hypothetical protein
MLPCYFFVTWPDNFGQVLRRVPIISKQAVTGDALRNLAFIKEQK